MSFGPQPPAVVPLAATASRLSRSADARHATWTSNPANVGSHEPEPSQPQPNAYSTRDGGRGVGRRRDEPLLHLGVHEQDDRVDGVALRGRGDRLRRGDAVRRVLARESSRCRTASAGGTAGSPFASSAVASCIGREGRGSRPGRTALRCSRGPARPAPTGRRPSSRRRRGSTLRRGLRRRRAACAAPPQSTARTCLRRRACSTPTFVAGTSLHGHGDCHPARAAAVVVHDDPDEAVARGVRAA